MTILQSLLAALGILLAGMIGAMIISILGYMIVLIWKEIKSEL